MKSSSDTQTPELALDGQPIFDLNIESGCEWPMPPVKAWKPEPARDLLMEFWNMVPRGWGF